MLQRHAVMAAATLDPGGNPHNTMVAYADDGLNLFFLVSRKSQTFANLCGDDRVALAIGDDFVSNEDIQGLSISGRADEVFSTAVRTRMTRCIAARHGDNFNPDAVDFDASVLVCARPRVIRVIDFSKAPGHADLLWIDEDGVVSETLASPPDWGPAPARRRLS